MKTTCSSSRRHFLGLMAAGSAALSFSPLSAGPAWAGRAKASGFSFHVFSKHLQFLGYEAMAEVAAEIGFDGVDLAVRPGGHVLPENVREDLPKAVKAIQKNDLQALLMTTAVIDAGDRLQQQVLETASEQGIQFYRTDWLKYPKDASVPKVMEAYQQQLSELEKLSRKLSIHGSYQNHSGSHYVGAPVWDIAMILRKINSEYLGTQYDIRHATVEGGFSWPLGLDMIHPFINTLVIKDFRWEHVNGKWEVVNTPVGEGMVDFTQYFSLLKSYGIAVPISLHYEYEMPEHDPQLSEAEKISRTKEVMKKDLETLKKYMSAAKLI